MKVVKRYIFENLRHLDQAYRRETDQKKATYYSKLAILELCGWIEISMDNIVLAHSSRKLRVMANVHQVEDNVRRTYGFDYDKHFRKMLINLVGVVACEQLEAGVDATAKTRLGAQLAILKRVRDSLAHTYIHGATPAAIDAPSVTMARLDDVYKGLKEFQQVLRNL